MDKVGLAAALQNFGQWADGFPEVPAFEDLTHNERVQSAVDTARDHVQNLFTAKAVGPELDLDASELEFSANDDEWDQPYGLEDDNADIDNTTETDLEHRRTIDDYAVKAIAKDPSSFEWDNGHGDQDISVNGHIKGGQATQQGLTLTREERTNKAYTDLLLTQRMRDSILEQNDYLERLHHEIRMINAVQTFVNEKIKNDVALTLQEREDLARSLRYLDLDIDDYVDDNGNIIDPDRLNDDLDAARDGVEAKIEENREAKIASLDASVGEPPVLENVAAEERVNSVNSMLAGFMSFSPAPASVAPAAEETAGPLIEREYGSAASVIDGEEDNYVVSNVNVNLSADFTAAAPDETAVVVAEAEITTPEIQDNPEQALGTSGVASRTTGFGVV